jgi:hypothetical protein
MSAEAASTTSSAAVQPRGRRFARWRPSVALASVVGALIGSQVVALALLLAAGGKGAPDWVSALSIVVADAVLLAVIIAVARKGAVDVGPSTFGIRRTNFWGSDGWMVLTYFAISIFNAIWLTLVGTGTVPRSEDPNAAQITIAGAVLVAFGVAVVAPIVEEVVFPRLPVPRAHALEGPVARRDRLRPRLRPRALRRIPAATAAVDGGVRRLRLSAVLVHRLPAAVRGPARDEQRAGHRP